MGLYGIQDNHVLNGHDLGWLSVPERCGGILPDPELYGHIAQAGPVGVGWTGERVCWPDPDARFPTLRGHCSIC